MSRDLLQPAATLALAAAVALHAVQPAVAQAPIFEPKCEFVTMDPDVGLMSKQLHAMARRTVGYQRGLVFPQQGTEGVTGYHVCTW